jgi:hypothetical protein
VNSYDPDPRLLRSINNLWIQLIKEVGDLVTHTHTQIPDFSDQLIIYGYN